MNNLGAYLTKKELVELLILGHRSLGCNNYDDLQYLILDLKTLFHFENTFCINGNAKELIGVSPSSGYDLHNISYPTEYLTQYFAEKYYTSDLVFHELAKTLMPVNWLKLDEKHGEDYPGATLSRDFNISYGWSHAAVDADITNFSAFYFGGSHSEINTENCIRTQKVLEYIIPFYAEAYKRVLKRVFEQQYNLTFREIEVLNWIKEGKSSWDISKILECSERTVIFHVNNIKHKLNAVSRAQAVAIALHHNIIQF